MKLIFTAQTLLEAPEYRSFLKAFYKINKSENPQFSYAYIAKQCQFGSKSFIKDVIDAKKNISTDSAHKLISGLSLPRIWGDYFLNLVLIDKKHNQRTQETLLKENFRLKERILSRKPIVSENSADIYFSYPNWPYIYAALGDEKIGASVKEIKSRTGFEDKNIIEVIDFLISEKLAIKKNDRFIASSNSAFFQNLGKSNFFKRYFLKSIFNLHQKAQKGLNGDSALFYTISLSVSSAKMPQFKQDLADLFDKFTTQIESPTGDKIAELTCGFHIL